MIDEALDLLSDQQTIEALPAIRRVAAEHWDDLRRQDAEDLLAEFEAAG